MSERPRPKRVARSATVLRTEQLSPAMVRVVLGGPDLAALPELEFTDHYVKLLFPPPGAGYGWPFDPDEIRCHPAGRGVAGDQDVHDPLLRSPDR